MEFPLVAEDAVFDRAQEYIRFNYARLTFVKIVLLPFLADRFHGTILFS